MDRLGGVAGMTGRYLLMVAVAVGLMTAAGCAGSRIPLPGRSVGSDPRCMQRVGTGASDRQVGTRCDDRFFAGSGDDTQQGGGGQDLLFGGTGEDIQLGDDGDDVLFGGGGADWQSGGHGDDTLIPGSGNGHADGGPGSDTLVVEAGYWVYDEEAGGWRNATTGETIRVEAMERVVDTDGRQIWP